MRTVNVRKGCRISSKTPRTRGTKRQLTPKGEKPVAEVQQTSEESTVEHQKVSDSLIEVFDFKKNWDVIVPHLHHPDVEAALAHGMNAYRVMRGSLSIAHTGGPGTWIEPWDPERGPLDNDSTNHWALRCNELLDEAIESGEIEFEWPEDDDVEAMGQALQKHSELASQFYPKPDSLEWYQLHNAGHYLAPWQRALGRRIFPELVWKIMTGDFHSTAYGTDKDGEIKIIFDILSFEIEGWTATEIIEASSARREGPPQDSGEELTQRPSAAFFKDGTIFTETLFRNQRRKDRQSVQTSAENAVLG